MKRRIIIFGAAYPPFGGVSTFCLRLIAYIHSQFKSTEIFLFDPFFFPNKSISVGQLVCPRLRPTLLSRVWLLILSHIYDFHHGIHIVWNGSSLYSLLVGMFLPLSSRRILILHSGSVSIDSFFLLNPLFRSLARRTLSTFSTLISLSESQSLLYKYLGLHYLELKPCLPTPAFDSHYDLISVDSPRVPVIVGSGYGLEYYRHELFIRLAQQYPQYNFDLFIYGPKDPELLDFLLSHDSLLSNFSLHQDLSEIDFLKFLSTSACYIRTSDVDSWCIASSDAVYLGLYVIASDVCERHPSIDVFAHSSFSSLDECFKNAINVDFYSSSTHSIHQFLSQWTDVLHQAFEDN